MNPPPFNGFGVRVDAVWVGMKITKSLVVCDKGWEPFVGPESDDDPGRYWRAANTIALFMLWSHPGAALAWTLNEWRHDTFGEGVSDTLMRTARAVLEAHHAPAEDEAVAALAVSCRTHARAFLATIDARLPSYATAEGFATALERGARNDDSPAGWTAWIRDFYGPHPAAEDGAPWLSVRLADYLRTAFGAHDEADAWLALERDRSAALQPDLPGMPPRHALPGWTVESGAVRDGVSPAWFNLAAVTWVARERAQQPYPTSMLMLPFARALATANPTAPGGAWTFTAVDPKVLADLERSGALTTVESQALFRSLPELARQAANAPGREVVVWSDGAAEVTVCMDGNNRTAVNVRGGWGAFAAALGFTSVSTQVDLRRAAHGFAHLKIQWSATDVANGITSLINDFEDRPAEDRVRFALPRMLWPGFSTELRRAQRDRPARPRIPVPRSLPPSTNPKLGAGPSRLELAALTWIREHVESIVDELGAPVPWSDLADMVKLSEAKQRSRREATLALLLDLWRTNGRWVCTDQGTGRPLWRPVYGWTGPGSLLEGREQVVGGRELQARSKLARKQKDKR